ncbi:MAG TPA: tripartite tricarboxylate transporter substrate binding protein [Beijerinckiaceae bacterium]|nr:tripartite tricarboxylate transporter substrate binding protein [Beijerinckiaceae bacterium]
MDRRHFLKTALATTSAIAGTRALAQAPGDAGSYPNHTVTLVVPFSAGSMTDILARTLAEKLSERWKQNVVVENRPGIAGTAGVAKTAPDGYTLMLTSNGHTVIKAVNPNVAFDPVKDFVAVTPVASTPSILIVPPDSPTKTLKELIDTAKAKPGALNYSSAGLGSSTGIAAELLKQITKTNLVVVPHRGLPESQTAVIRGDVAMAFTFFNVGGDLIQGGKLRAVAVTGNKRMSQLPDVPTFAEAGLPDFTYDSWFGVFVPAGTPKPIVDKVARDVAAALQGADVKARFDPQGVEIVSSTPEKFGEVLRSDAERYGALFPKQGG